MVRGIRGAITVDHNEPAEIVKFTKELLVTMAEANNIQTEDIVSISFSSTTDLDSEFPAVAARRLGWVEVPLFGAQEIDCPTGLPLCIRVLILLNTDVAQSEIKHSYLRGATVLRPDVVK